jgi:predicted nucleic-acid-binding protein
MQGLDTNVLVRYLVKDERKQAEKASAYIRRTVSAGEKCYISYIVLCELVWVLESAYGYPKNDITGVLEKMMSTKQFEIESKDIVRQSIHDYKNGSADLADYLIGRMNHAKGCDVTATFDRALKDCPSFFLLD